MRYKSFIFIFLLVILSFNFVSSIAPTQTVLNTNVGLEIFVSSPDNVPINQTTYLDLHVINNTDNKYLNNSLYNCTLFFHNTTGQEILTLNFTNSGVLNENLTLLGGNFTVPGIYKYHIVCFSSVDGDGVIEKDFIVSRTGKTLTTAEALLYPILAGIIFFLFLLSGWIMYALPYSNRKKDGGEAIIINNLKYAKLGFILVTHALLLWLLNVLIALSDSYISLTMYYGFVSFVYNALLTLSYPLFLVIFVLAGYNLYKDFKDIQLNKMLYRK